MNPGQWQWLNRLSQVVTVTRTEPVRREHRLIAFQRHIAIPVRLLVIGVVFYYFYMSTWLVEVVNTYGVVFETMQNIIAVYAAVIVVIAVIFYVIHRFPPGLAKWFVFAMGLGDAVFLASLTVMTGGFESPLYWVYPGIIGLNAVSIPLAPPQVILNLVLCILFLVAGLIEADAKIELSTVPFRNLPKRPTPIIAPEDLADLSGFTERLTDPGNPLARSFLARLSQATRERVFAFRTNQSVGDELRADLVLELNRAMRPPQSVVVTPVTTDPLEVTPALQVLRMVVLTLLTFSVYGLQVLLARQREILEEEKEVVARTERLRTAGRVAAEFAHQIKNPLAIINNVVYSLQKTAGLPKDKVEIIQEEVNKCDRIITQIMGYGELSEGKLERLDVRKEIEAAIREVFPPGIPTGVEVRRAYPGHFPPLLMQRRHFTDILTNLLLNAREAMEGRGCIHVTARRLEDDVVELCVRDEGQGIPPDKLERIFQAYYTTKTRGTGLGLAIVKHNVELYSGTIRVQSELGKGAQFTVCFPGKTLTE